MSNLINQHWTGHCPEGCLTITLAKLTSLKELALNFSNSLIIHALMTQSDCFNSVRCMDLDTQ